MHADGRPDDRPPDPAAGETERPTPPGLQHHHHRLPHPHLIDADEDRWKWRAHIRRDPRKLFFYRIGVALAGSVLMIAAAITGPLPGPGGIPLFLLGLAVWASEFEWAQNLMLWFKARFRRYHNWSRGGRSLFWVAVALFALTAVYLTLLIHGIPPWLPKPLEDGLHRIPGLG